MSTTTLTPATCACIQCRRPMRPRGVLRKEMPGTMAWGHSGKCKSCVQPYGERVQNQAAPRTQAAPGLGVQGSATVKDLRVAHAAAGLDSFIARRNARLRASAAGAAALRAAGLRTT